jgi:hypothetical protein
MMKLVAMIETIKSKTGQLPEQYLQRLCWQSNASSECVNPLKSIEQLMQAEEHFVV